MKTLEDNFGQNEGFEDILRTLEDISYSISTGYQQVFTKSCNSLILTTYDCFQHTFQQFFRVFNTNGYKRKNTTRKTKLKRYCNWLKRQQLKEVAP